MKKLIASVIATVLAVFGLTTVASISPAYAVDYDKYINATAGDNTKDNLMETIKNIISVILAIVGLVAVIMIIIGGISFITSQGDTAKVTKARNTILYGVIGLVVALLAFAIVNFVLSSDTGIFS